METGGCPYQRLLAEQKEPISLQRAMACVTGQNTAAEHGEGLGAGFKALLSQGLVLWLFGTERSVTCKQKLDLYTWGH